VRSDGFVFLITLTAPLAQLSNWFQHDMQPTLALKIGDFLACFGAFQPASVDSHEVWEHCGAPNVAEAKYTI
jgi:hypothetical protein